MSRIAANPLRSLVVLAILRILASRAVIDFLEQLVVLFDERVVRLDFERLLVGDSRLIEVAFMLVGDGEIVERLGVLRVDVHGALPPVDGFTPETALRDGDAEFDLFLRVRPCVGGQRPRRGCEHEQNSQDAGSHRRSASIYVNQCAHRSVKRAEDARRTRVPMSKAYATEIRRKTSNSTENYFDRRPPISSRVHCFATRLSELRAN